MTRSHLFSPRLALAVALALSLLAAYFVAAAPAAQAAPAQADTIVSLVNAERSQRGLRPLRVNAALTSIAQDWSQRQAAADAMSHRPNFTANYPAGWTRAAENVAWYSADDPRAIVTSWMNSSGHRANILNPELTDIGVGYARSSSGRYYATQNFAAYPGSPVPATSIGRHDYNGDGRADVLAVNGSGQLLLYPGNGRGGWQSARTIGNGWQGHDLVAPGDFNGDGRSDLLAVAPGGQLYFYAGRTNGFAARVQIGTGWQVFTHVFSPGDFSGDGRADVIGVRPNGEMTLYYGTGAGRVSGSARIGTGWQIYNDVLPGGDFNGDGRADLFAKDASGRLFAYYNRGGSTMSSRVQIGNGWTDFRQLASVGDFNGDGATDYFAVSASTGRAYLYPGTGRSGFAPRVQIGNGWAGFTTVI
ncbi:FG-GAP-like repeat-containing protein [Georgenia faecalis]|uniref:FG-GAP-like repeat-containing protein n=1 Tax=Georgenia faecalis TaxID=2483799 RepID=UPI0013DEA463|nr:FG-GAP-like repeat-containing protein [Georgenia faecalis]